MLQEVDTRELTWQMFSAGRRTSSMKIAPVPLKSISVTILFG